MEAVEIVELDPNGTCPRCGGNYSQGIGPKYHHTAEHCQYCGNSWQQRRTIGTPRLDAVPCPKCKRLV